MTWHAKMLHIATEIKRQMIEHGYPHTDYILKFNKTHVHIYGPCVKNLPIARNDNDQQ